MFISNNRTSLHLWRKDNLVIEKSQNIMKLGSHPRVSAPLFRYALRPATLFKKRLWYRCFYTNFEKFEHFNRTPPVASSIMTLNNKILQLLL